MSNLGTFEIATITILAVILGSFLRNISDSLFNKWTKDYVERKEFEELKKVIREDYLHRKHYEETIDRLLKELEDVKRIVLMLAVRFGLDISDTNLTISAKSIKEAIKNNKEHKE